MKKTPDLSVIIILHDGLEAALRSIETLRGQDGSERVELVLVSKRPVGNVGNAGRGFLNCRVVEADGFKSLGAAKAAGVRVAEAPVVAFMEDHTRLEKGWVKALVEAHKGDWAAVGPALVNANPATGVSWANFLLEYSEWLAPAKRAEVAHLPGNNGSYKRSILTGFGKRLDDMLETEYALHDELVAGGKKLLFEPAAVTRHINPSLLRPSLRLRLFDGRYFASSRSRAWTVPRRLLYAAGSPVIPLVRAARLVKRVASKKSGLDIPAGAFAAMALFLAISAAGEFLGYLLGAGAAKKAIVDAVANRRLETTTDERKMF